MSLYRKFTVMAVILVTLMLDGCDKLSQPSASDGNEAVLGFYKKYIDSGDLIIEDFKKTDGIAQEVNGLKLYTMTATATFKFPKGCSAFYTTCPVGFSQTRTGHIPFMKSENGWHFAPNGFAPM
jgi:hypothetical protein